MRAWCPSKAGASCVDAAPRFGPRHTRHQAWHRVGRNARSTHAEAKGNANVEGTEGSISFRTPQKPKPTNDDDDKPKHNRRGDNARRDAFTDTLRETHSGGRVSKRDFKSHLGKLQNPPAVLDDVTVVLVGTKKAGNVGAVARACGSFECEDLRVVSPRCDPTTRASLSAAKGAQHIVHGAGVYDTLEDALLDVDCAVAFHVWDDTGLVCEVFTDVDDLIKRYPRGSSGMNSTGNSKDTANDTQNMRDPVTEDPLETLFPGYRASTIRGGGTGATNGGDESIDESFGEDETDDDESSPRHGWRRRTHETVPVNRSNRGNGKLALVFGREVEGLTTEEVNACDAMCQIPTGRLIESLSVSHAAVIILSRYFQSRQSE
jgi:tRNA G18 (ribose-2'-O)-methylase SpoU